MVMNTITLIVGIIAAFFVVLWVLKSRKRTLDRRENFLALHGRLEKIGLRKFSSLIAELATGDPWECRQLMKKFEQELMEADPTWRYFENTFYNLLDEFSTNDWANFQQKLGEIMKDKNKKWKIEFIEVQDASMDLRQSASMTVGAGNQPAPTVGIMGQNVTEVNTATAKNIVEQTAQIQALQASQGLAVQPAGTLGQSLSAEQLALMDQLQNLDPLDPKSAEIKAKLYGTPV